MCWASLLTTATVGPAWISNRHTFSSYGCYTPKELLLLFIYATTSNQCVRKVAYPLVAPKELPVQLALGTIHEPLMSLTDPFDPVTV
jgi:hypothetical protein